METLFLAILSVCINTTNCNKAEDFARYISPPIVIEDSLLANERDWLPLCVAQIEILKANLPEEYKQHTKSTLCTRKEAWDKSHPTE